jgi:hypothetical protein
MTRLWFLVALVACSCSTEPIAPDAGKQLEQIATDYRTAHAVEGIYCPAKPACGDVRRAGYDAEAAYTTANTQRTSVALLKARDNVSTYVRATMGLL